MRREDLKIIADELLRYVANLRGPNTRTPPGVPTGFGLAVSGGTAAKTRDWTTGDRGAAVQSRLTS